MNRAYVNDSPKRSWRWSWWPWQQRRWGRRRSQLPCYTPPTINSLTRACPKGSEPHACTSILVHVHRSDDLHRKSGNGKDELADLIGVHAIHPLHNSAENTSLDSQQRDDHLKDDPGDSLENLAPHTLHLPFCLHYTMWTGFLLKKCAECCLTFSFFRLPPLSDFIVAYGLAFFWKNVRNVVWPFLFSDYLPCLTSL